MNLPMSEIPRYCHSCGSAYPRTGSAIAAAREYVAELELSESEQAQLTESIDQLVTEGPRQGLAADRFKRLVQKAGGKAGEVFKEILVAVLSEAVKKAMWG